MPRYRFGYGTASVEVDIAAPALELPAAPQLPDEVETVRAAIRNPIGTPALADIVRPGDSVALVVNDITRLTRTDLFLPVLVEELNRAGIPDSCLFAVFALGIHRAQTEAERRTILGDELHGRLRNFDHDCHDQANLVHVGRTRFGNEFWVNRQVWEADRVILTGEIMYHLIAGYSGGRKSLVPGVAGAVTTTFNHRMIFDPNCRAGLLQGNPAHEDLLEACRLFDPDFLVNVVLSPEGRLIQAVAGHYDLAHREGCRAVDRWLAAPIDGLYDVVIASAGGFPLDIDLRQAHKGMDNAVKALKPGGTLVFFAECANGAGHPRFQQFIESFPDDHSMEAALREKFEVGGHKAWWIKRMSREYDVRLISALPEAFVRRCGFEPATLPLPRFPQGARIAVMPHAGHTFPRLSPGDPR